MSQQATMDYKPTASNRLSRGDCSGLREAIALHADALRDEDYAVEGGELKREAEVCDKLLAEYDAKVRGPIRLLENELLREWAERADPTTRRVAEAGMNQDWAALGV